MARLPRYVLPGHPQHVIQRGNNRNIIFASEDDFYFFESCLIEACIKFDVMVHAYVLMTNHVHLLMTPSDEQGLGKVMQSVGRRYVQYFNFTYQRTGTLWEGRYKATLIDTDHYLLTCYRYIELNPVRAHMVAIPEDYRWSSYHANALGKYDQLVTSHDLYLQLGNSNKERQRAYRSLFKNHIPEQTIVDIRDATNKAWVLGTEQFEEEIASLVERRTRPLSRGGRR